jgi:flagella basal body P-ring formation protein FlgA
MRRTVRAILVVLAALAAGPAVADEVALRTTARVEAGADVRLGDVAELSGPGAVALAHTVIVPASEVGGGWVRVDVERVRSALDARGDVAWGLVALRGSACAVSARDGGQKGAAAVALDAPEGQTADQIDGGTVGGRIAGRIASGLGVDPARVRLAFDDRDADLLSMPTAGLSIEARITGASDRVPVRLTIFRGETLVASRAVAVRTLVLRPVAVTVRLIRRGEEIGESDITIQERWVGPGTPSLEPALAMGSAARTALDAGRVMTVGDVESPLVIRRGDLVTVSSIAGGVMVRTTARARSAAREGEAVDLETLDADRRKRRTFQARACGRGLAIIAADIAPASLTPEESP